MTQSNEMPDVLFVDPPNCWPWNDAAGFFANSEQSEDTTEYTRKGAPSPWIDPKLQPIPEGLADDRMLWVKVSQHDLDDDPISLDVFEVYSEGVAHSRLLQAEGFLLGYIILLE